MKDGFDLLYILALAMITGWLLIVRVPSILHMSLLAGASFIHGIVLVGAILLMAHADDNIARSVGFIAIVLSAANVVGGYLVTDRLLELFERGRRAQRSRVAELEGEGGKPGRIAQGGTGDDDDGSSGTASVTGAGETVRGEETR